MKVYVKCIQHVDGGYLFYSDDNLICVTILDESSGSETFEVGHEYELIITE